MGKMVKKLIFSAFFILFSVYYVFSQTVTLDTALSNAADEISLSVPQGTKIAVLNITSDYQDLSDYIINELTANLVNKRMFQIVPRNTVELEAANREFGFQMSGFVSDDSQKRIGQFLGAGTIITGTVSRDSENSYRLVINAIDLESFSYQSTYRGSIQNNRQVNTLTGNRYFYEDYTVGQRLAMGGLNVFGGAGSLMNGHSIGGLITATEIAGIICIVFGNTSHPPHKYKELRTSGGILIGAGIALGFVLPFFHNKPGTNVSQNHFPLAFEVVSSNNKDIGLGLYYNMKF